MSHRPEALRVLVVTNMWPREDRPGFGSFVAAQVDSLAEYGIESRVHVVEGDRSSWAYLRDIGRIRELVRSWQPALVHAHFGLAGWTARRHPAPLVLSVCGDDLLGVRRPGGGRTLKSRIMVRMTQSAAHAASVIICKSEGLRDALPLRDRPRAVVIPNGVNLDMFHPGGRAEARLRLGMDPNAEIVLFPHDRSQPLQKRFDLAHAAMQLLRERRPLAQLLHVSGEPPERMPHFFRAANCMLLTSATEGSPNTVKEALACDLPVVSVPVGDVPMWLSQVDNSALVAADPRALAEAMDTILTRGQPAGASRVWPALDARRVAGRLRAVYDAVARGA